MNSASYNSDCNGKIRWDGDGDGAGDDDDGDDDLDDARDDGDDDEDDLPSPGGVLPSRICPPERSFLLWWFPPRCGGGTSDLTCPPKELGYEGYVCRRRGQGMGPPTQAARWRGLGGSRHQGAWSPGGPPPGALRPVFVISSESYAP